MASKKKSAGLLFDEVLPQAQRTARSLLSLDPQEDVPASQQALEMALGFVPGIGQAMALRDIERARRANDPAAAAMAAASFVPFGRLAGLGKKAGPVMSELDVYHGSPHRFEEFDASKIGTGEGAQAYGHGIYLAESPNVAKGYQKQLAQIKPEMTVEFGLPITGKSKKFAETALQSSNGDADSAIKNLRENLQFYSSVEAKNAATEAINALKTAKITWGKDYPIGHFYTADLPDEMVDRMLDWDKPLSEQSPYVQKIIGDEIKRIGGGSTHSGEQAYKELMFQARMERAQKEIMKKEAKGQASAASPSAKSQAKAMEESRQLQAIDASERLRQLGIPGIKYLDAGSRGQGGSGTRNFVVFPGEEKKVKILKRE